MIAHVAVESPIPVLFLSDLLDVGGAESQLAELVRALDPARVRPIVAVLRDDRPVAFEWKEPPVRLAMRGPSDLAVLIPLMRLAREERVRAIYTTHVRAALLARFLRRTLRPPPPQRRFVVLTSEHSYKNPPARPLPNRLRRATASLSDRVIAVSEAQARELRAQLRMPPERVLVIPNGVDPARFDHLPSGEEVRARFGIAQADPVFVMVARLSPVKDHGTMLRAMERVSGHLILVGDGPERSKLEESARKSSLAGRIHFAGTQTDLRPYYAAAWAICLSSIEESQPVALLEAMAARLPVLATRVGGVPEVVMDGETGLLVPPGDPEALAAALARLASDPAWRRAAGEAGRRRAEAEFSIHARARKIEDLIASLVEEACR